MRNVRFLLPGALIMLLLYGISVLAGDRPAGNPATQIPDPGWSTRPIS